MSWESRGSSGRYYTRSLRVNGRVKRQYAGNGEFAHLVAQTDALLREEQRLRKAEEKAERARERAKDRAFAEQVERACEGAVVLTRAALLAAGYHQHKRGEWRRRRTVATETVKQLANVPENVRALLPKTPEEAWALIRRAENGDEAVLPVLREGLLQKEIISGWGGDLPQWLERRVINTLAGNNLLVREALECQVKQMRAELAGPAPTALETLLVERVVLTWLDLHEEELRFAQAESMPLAKADYFQRAVSQRQRRYLAAIKVLATVRKLALPAIQVNLAKNQLNIAG